MVSGKQKKRIVYALLMLGILLEAFMEFKLHRRFVFLWDDSWYATNLVTGEPLKSLSDIWEGQVWHYFNWGGRSINHGLLQLVLMSGELCADLLNLGVTFLLCLLVCEVAGRRDVPSYALAFFMLIALNTDIKLSMFWQSGAVNYLYSTCWILLFLLLYIRQIRNPEADKWKLIELWILPLGLVTGWSNENMGPMCCVIAVLTMSYFKWVLKKKVPAWMGLGAVTSLVGSVLLILAPGNFVRKTYAEELSLWETLYDRFFSMLMAGMSFLFMAVVLVLIFLILYLRSGNKVQHYQIALMLAFGLAFGAMVLSPTFPNRAAFGLQVICMILILSFVQGIRERTREYDAYLGAFVVYLWGYGMYLLYAGLRLPL